GIGDCLANVLSPLGNDVLGLRVLPVIIGLPVLPPLLGPGAVIAQVIGALLRTHIGMGNIAPATALPALRAINPQVGGDCTPVGPALGEAEPETVEVGVPAALLGRMVTGPLAVVIGWLFSAGLYTS